MANVPESRDYPANEELTQMETKKARVITTRIEGSLVTFEVRDAGNVTLDLSRLSDEVRDRAMVHGMIQRVSDAAAMSRNDETGKPASPEDKLGAMARLVDHYNSGTHLWAMIREGGGGGNEGGLLGQVLMRAYKAKPGETSDQHRERILAYVKKRTAKERAALLAEPRLAQIAADIRAEQGKGIDTSEMLDELNDL